MESTNALKTILSNAGADFVGFAKMPTSEIPCDKDLSIAISIGIVYSRSKIEHLDSDVNEFHEYISYTKEIMGRILEKCDLHLKQKGYKTWIPPISADLPQLQSIFSHKKAATIAGLGWIGKNCLFISNEFGCGSRLATVFTDAPFPTGQSIAESSCGTCNECVKACPCRSIKGVNWKVGMAREELFNPWLCKKYRASFEKKSCGLCIKACPVQRGK